MIPNDRHVLVRLLSSRYALFYCFVSYILCYVARYYPVYALSVHEYELE